MQNLVVAGGAGFIGSSLCKSLLNQNYNVSCIDNLLTGDKKNIEELLKNPKFEFVAHDITHPLLDIKNKAPKIDYIFHLASPASPNKKSKRSYINHPIETLLANSVGTYNLLNLALDCRSRFLYASSSEIYGDPMISPQKEDYFGNVNPNGIRSVYDEGKRFGEALVMAYVRKYNIDARIVRIFNTYGPNMQADDGRVVSNFVKQAINNNSITIYGDGSQTRSFCYIDDMILGIEKVMFSPRTKGEVINLGNPDERTILELAKMVKQMIGSSSEIISEELSSDDPKSRNPDIEKAKKLIGWEPKVSIKEGLKKTIQYFRQIN